MSDERARRVGHNEALFRQVNERIEALNEAFSPASDTFSVVCECGDLDCTDHIDVPPSMYERTRQNAAHFLVKPGHEAPDVEHVVLADSTYLVVEKYRPEAVDVAEQTDPRG